MEYSLDEKKLSIQLEIGKNYTGNIACTNKGEFLFSPRADGIHVFKTTGKVIYYIKTLQVDSKEYYDDNLSYESYLKLLKESIIPKFFSQRMDIIE